MQFKPELCERILAGEKTQTRRVVKLDEAYILGSRNGCFVIKSVVRALLLKFGENPPRRSIGVFLRRLWRVWGYKKKRQQ